MGRQVKRVASDFSWPLHVVWKGYINPYQGTQCKICDGTGWNTETKKLYDEWYSFDKTKWVYIRGGRRRYNSLAWEYNLDQDDVQALLDADRLWDFTRVPRTKEQKKIVDEKIKNGGNSWLPFNNGWQSGLENKKRG